MTTKLCQCGKHSRTGSEYCSDCKVVCACGCGGRAKYAYLPGHRPIVTCVRCHKQFTPTDGQTMCAQCRRHVKDGRPAVKNQELISMRKKQAASPEGRKWCAGCERYRLLRFFGRAKDGYYSRCKPCQRVQQHASSTKKKYGITREQYLAIKESQGGKCAICKVATGASKALAVDHDHTCCPSGGSCGKCVRGLLCATCNQMLGFARDNREYFVRAVNYLDNPPARKILFDE